VRGVVTRFDERAGVGVVTADDGGIGYAFHAVAIAGDSRTIAVGTAVDFDVVPGLLGRWQAAHLRTPLEPAVDLSHQGE
jgi:cold shock CspA family protein